MNSSYEQTASRRVYKIALDCYLVFISLVLLRFGIRYAHSANSWSLADWLINYHGGFVRRGFLGEFILQIAHLLHLAAPWTVLLFQVAAYGLVFIVFRRLLLDSGWSPWIVALALSPATISFPLLNLAGSFRKEILIFAALAALLYLLLYQRPKELLVCVSLAVALPVIVLSYEPAFFYFGYFFCALFLVFGEWRRSLRIFAPGGLLAIIALGLARHFPGNLSAAQKVCSGAGFIWQGRFIGPCGGAILALTQSSQFAHEDLVSRMHSCPYYYFYPLLAVLAILPIVGGFLQLRFFRSFTTRLRVLGATILVSGALSSAVFYYALDWGRFIYMHVMCAGLLILTIEVLKQRKGQEAEANSMLSFERKNMWLWVGILVYSTCWTLTYCPSPGYLPPPLGVAQLFFDDPSAIKEPPTFLEIKYQEARSTITRAIKRHLP